MPKQHRQFSGAVGAVRRQPRVPQHRPRVHHPPRRWIGPHRGAHRACRRRRRDPELRRHRRRLRALRALARCRTAFKPGDRIAFMLEPSLPFYLSLFGAMMMGAISVPLFTLFGLDGLRLRVDDCKPKLLITNAEKAEVASSIEGVRVVVADAALLDEIAHFPSDLSAGDARQRPGRVPVHVGHHARTAGSGQALASRAGDADVRGALRHRHPAGRRVLLPFFARLGPRPLARHAGAAGAGRHDRHFRRPLRCGAADEGAARTTRSRTCRRRRRTTG